MADVAIVADRDAGGALAADLIEALVASKPDAVLGLATGSTPLPVWRSLQTRAVDLRAVRGFALDEYLGLPEGHPQSYRMVLEREVVGPLGMTADLVRVPGDRGNGPDAGAQFEAAIADAGGIDLQILGLGRTGHIGFNEPGSSLGSRTRVKALAAQTRIDNARFFASPQDVPTHCLTQGVGTILEARHLVVLAFGHEKADVVARTLEGAVTASVPASAVQLHPRVTVIVDEAAASQLAHRDYYRLAWAPTGAGRGDG